MLNTCNKGVLFSFFVVFVLYLCVMEDNNLKRISFPEIREIVKNFIGKKMSSPYIRGGIGIFNAIVPGILNEIKTDSPYIIEECRVAIVKRGSAVVTINMIEHEMKENTLFFFGTGCVVQVHSFTQDIELSGLMISNERMGMALGRDAHTAVAGNGTYLLMEVTPKEMDIADRILHIIWTLVHEDKLPESTINGLIHALLHYYEHLGLQRASAMSNEKGHGNRIFERFIHLINAHCKEEHSLSFYADNLCITPRYLGILVKKASGITAKEWIDRAVATCAKVMLRHGNKQIVEISDEMNFPNPSFFCKFFKRMTGVTPQQYRQGQ